MFGKSGIAILNTATRSAIKETKPPQFRAAPRASSSSSSSSSSTPSTTTPEAPPAQGTEANTDPIAAPSKPYIPLYHHRDPSLFPPLIPGSLPYITHNLSSAFSAAISLIASPESREKFTALANLDSTGKTSEKSDGDNLYGGCVINTNVVGQADMGFVKVLALFDELNSPLYQSSKGRRFDVKEFMDGVGYALRQFQNASARHNEKVRRLLETKDASYDFAEAATADEESPERALMRMTAPPYWKFATESIKGLLRVREFLAEIAKRVPPEETRITHVALLSARVARIEEPVAPEGADDDDGPDAPLEDDSLSSPPSRPSAPQTVTRLEVLYESEVTLPPEENSDERERTKTVVAVATFEACIDGDPNGEMRWRLCGERPAIEFGYDVGSISLSGRQ